MRRLLLLAALCMVATLVFAPVALAQADINCADVSYGEAQLILGEDSSDPNNLDSDDDGEACEENAGDGSTASPEPDDSTSTASPEPDDDSTSTATAESDDDSATSTATAESDDDASATATASALPDTGGPISSVMLTVLPLMLIAGGGILSAIIVRRR